MTRVDTLTPQQRSLRTRLRRRLVLDQNLPLLLSAENPTLRRSYRVDLPAHNTIIIDPHHRRGLSHRHFITLPVTPWEGSELRSVSHITLTERVRVQREQQLFTTPSLVLSQQYMPIPTLIFGFLHFWG